MLWLAIFAFCAAVQAAYWLVLGAGFRRARGSAAPVPEPLPPISVVVAARNEAACLPALLGALARQSHPRYEVVVVDDASTDGSAGIVQARATRNASIRLVRVHAAAERAGLPRKQHALACGIAAATYDLLAFTDADCTPPPGWLEALARHHAAHADALLIGYGPYYRQPGLLNRLARYETFVTGFLTAAAAGLGRPYMALGRNLSYSKHVFTRAGGFDRARRSMCGDDDLFVQEATRLGAAAATLHLFDAATRVPSPAPQTWRGWLHQKRRHTATGRFYGRNVQAHLALFQATSVLLWLAPLLAGPAGAALLTAKLLLQGVILRPAATALGERDLLSAQPLLELLYAGYNLLVAPLGLLRPPRQWLKV